MSGNACQSAVHRKQRRIESFCQGQITCVVCTDIVAESPNARQKEVMGIAFDTKRAQILERFATARRRQKAGTFVTPKHLRDFEVEQVRRMKGAATEQSSFDCGGIVSPKEDFKQCGRIDDDHRASRSARTASAGDSSG